MVTFAPQVVGFIAAVVGCVGIFDSVQYKNWHDSAQLCRSREGSGCRFPMYSSLRLGVFFTFAIITALILSIISLIIGLIVDCSKSSLKGIVSCSEFWI
jgi:hypothetical protein